MPRRARLRHHTSGLQLGTDSRTLPGDAPRDAAGRLGRALATAARHLVPADAPAWAQIAQ
jgi:hypothetical protein